MARITGTPATELAKSELRRIHLVKLDFASGAVLAHDGVGSYVYSGDTYVGVGEFGSIDNISEDISLRASRIRLNLTGVVAALVADVQTDDYHMRDALIYILALDETYAEIGTPVLCWSGYMDAVTIELADGAAAISLTCMDRLGDLGRPRPFYLTDEAQQRRNTGDVGLEFAPQAVKEVTLNWGGVTYSGPPPSGDPGDGPGSGGRGDLP